MNFFIGLQNLMDKTKFFEFIAPLCLRLYLAPVFWYAGTNKLSGFDGVVEWFGNPDWGLGLPFPWFMAVLATTTEMMGAVLLIVGLGTRWISVPLMVTMLVAIFSVHLSNGWQAVLDPMSPWAPEHAADGIERLSRARDILREHGNYDWLTEHGSFVISNNGVEWAVTYLLMLLAIFFMGAGNLSIDRLLRSIFMK